MPISYTLVTEVQDLVFDLPNLFADPPLSINELFRQLSYHELHDLKVAQEGIGALKSERHNQVVHLVNEGLRRLHQRFELIHPYKDYDIPKEGVVIPLSALAIQVLSIFLKDGGSVTFRTHPVPGEVFVYNRRLNFPKSDCDYKVQVTWQNRHPTLRYIAVPADLEQPIYLSSEMLAALRAYVAGEMYGSMSTPDAAANAAKYRGKYETVCAEMEVTGSVAQGMLDKQVFHERGWR